MNDNGVRSSYHSAVSPSGHPGRFHPDAAARDAIPRLAPGAAAHRDAASVDRILGRELARGFRFGRDVALDSLLCEKEEIEKWAAVGSA